MAKNMPVPRAKALNIMKTIGNQSIILTISRLLLDTIYREAVRPEDAAWAASFPAATVIETNFDRDILNRTA
jgi:hypothetical protein